MPYPGLTPKQQGQIVRMLSTPCHPSVLDWIEASVPIAVGLVGKTFFYPDLKHLYTELTGEGIVGSILKAPAGFLEGGEGFGRGVSQLASGGEISPGSIAGDGFRMLGMAGAFFDQINYYAWIASLVPTGLIDWASLAYELEGCTPAKNFYTASGNLNNGACNLNAWNNAFDFLYDDPLAGPALSGTAANAPPGWGCVAAASASYYYLNGIPAPTAMAIFDGNTGAVYDYDEDDFGSLNAPHTPKVWNVMQKTSAAGGQSQACEAMLTAPGPFNVAVAVSGAGCSYPNNNVIGSPNAPQQPNRPY